MNKKRIAAGCFGLVAALFFGLTAYAGETDQPEGWYQDEKGTYFVDYRGNYPRNRWYWIGDRQNRGDAACYFFDKDGYLVKSGEVDGCTVNREGQWIVNGEVQHRPFRESRVNEITEQFEDEYGQPVYSDIDEKKWCEESAGTQMILVDKDSHRVQLYTNGDKVRDYCATFGQADGVKHQEGDLHTPEGEYYVCKKKAGGHLWRALGISYPNKSDADYGVAHGIIDEKARQAVYAANDAKSYNWNTNLGSYVEIHGNRPPVNATRGCTALRNSDVEDLYNQVGIGTRIVMMA